MPIQVYEQTLIPKKSSVAIVSSKDVDIKLAEETNTRHLFMHEEVKKWDVFASGERIAKLVFTTKNFDQDNAILFFAEYEPLHDFVTDLELQFAFKKSGLLRSARIIYPHEQYSYPSSQLLIDEVKKLPSQMNAGINFIDTRDYSLCLGTAGVYEHLGCTVSEEIEKVRFNYRTGHKKHLFSVKLPAQGRFKTWLMVSNERIVDFYNEESENLIRRADLNVFRKLEADGIYDRVPDSYEPTGEDAFWRNPAQHVGRLYAASGDSSYFRDIALLSMYASLDNQNPGGYWATRPKSLWLYNDYGIEENFYDTRFSTDAACFMLEADQIYSDNRALDAATKYADFLVGYIGEFSSMTDNGGYLVPDYMSEDGNANTHCSLNHLLAEMNFLYRMYMVTENEVYRKTAQSLKIAVKDTSEEWIKPDGDLWYCRLPDGNYGLQDYPTLTLNDLQESQEIFLQLYSIIDADFQRLIDAKTEYNNQVEK